MNAAAHALNVKPTHLVKCQCSQVQLNLNKVQFVGELHEVPMCTVPGGSSGRIPVFTQAMNQEPVVSGKT